MKTISTAKIGLGALALLASTTGTARAQPGAAHDDSWQFTVTPYLWIPGYDGNLKFNTPPGAGGNPHVHAGPVDVFDNIDAAFMGTASVKKGHWGAFVDFAHIDLSGEEGRVNEVTGPGGVVQIPINVSTTTGLQATLWSLAGTYEFYKSGNSSADAFVGFRHLDADPSLTWRFNAPLGLLPQSGHLSQDTSLTDGIVGVKGQYGFGNSNWFLNYYADVGAGDSDLTYQAMGGVGYAFKWGDVLLDYRLMHYDTNADTKVVDNMDLYGPALGARFRF